MICWIFLVEVDVVEALCRHVALVFHDGALGTFEIREAGSTSGLNALGFGISDLRFGQSQ